MRRFEMVPSSGGGGAVPRAENTSASQGGRIAGLDLWRAILMMGGLIRHAADWHVGNPVFDAVILASASFRMGAFFCISGLLTGYALLRRPAGAWLRHRVGQLGVPTLFGLIVLCPLLSLLEGWTHMLEGGRFTFAIDWYHIWFLVALLLYSVGAAGLDSLDRRRGTIAKFVDKMQTVEAISVAVGLATFVVILATTEILQAYTPARYWSPLSQFRWIAGYAMLFFFGFAVSRSDLLRRQVVWQARLACGAIASIALLDIYAFGFLPGLPDHPGLKPFAYLTGTAFGPLAVSLLILRSAFLVRRVPPPLRVLADASFTIYLLHLPYLAVSYAVLTLVDWGEYAECAVAIVVSGSLSVATHVLIVRRSPLLAFLLNGKPLKRREGHPTLPKFV